MNLLYTDHYNVLNKSLLGSNTPLNQKILLSGFFYTYRLTYTDPITKEKFYYMGYHKGSSKDPREDGYFSSGKRVRDIIKKHGSLNALNLFSKKILGIYSTKQEALKAEINYHAKLKVDTNNRFLNLARQTSLSFSFDNTGKTQTTESNKKRSDALINVQKMTDAGKKAVSNYQREVRVRTEEELERLRTNTLAKINQEAVCPHCGKIGRSYLSMVRWHYDNCLQAPVPSKQALEEREKLRDRFQKLNRNHPKNQNKENPP